MPTGRGYQVAFEQISVSAQQDFLEGIVPSDMVVALEDLFIGQGSDTESEQLDVAVNYGIGTTSGTGGAAATPTKRAQGDVASTVTWERNNTTKGSAGTITTPNVLPWNVLNGAHYLPTPEEQILWSPGDEIYVELQTTPADALTMSGYLAYAEYGG